MKFERAVIWLLPLVLVLSLFACSSPELPPDPPSEYGVGRVTKKAVPVYDPWAGEVWDVPEKPVDSLAPFYKVQWKIENGSYLYRFPARDTSGEATLSEMETFSRARFPDAVKEPDPDDWFPGKTTYDTATGEVTYHWAVPGTTADRKEATLEAFRKYGAIYRGDETKKCMYLTFDCGYETGVTGKILDTLAEKRVPGTFFVTGTYIRNNPELVGRMLNEGHVVGSHTNTHPALPELTVDEVVDEMKQTEAALKEAFPYAPDMIYMRPPKGSVNEWLLRLEAKLGYRTVLWSFAYDDWHETWQPSVEAGLGTAKLGLHPGAVYLLHAESSTNADMLGMLIDWIRGQGYEILPLCDIPAW